MRQDYILRILGSVSLYRFLGYGHWLLLLFSLASFNFGTPIGGSLARPFKRVLRFFLVSCRFVGRLLLLGWPEPRTLPLHLLLPQIREVVVTSGYSIVNLFRLFIDFIDSGNRVLVNGTCRLLIENVLRARRIALKAWSNNLADLQLFDFEFKWDQRHKGRIWLSVSRLADSKDADIQLDRFLQVEVVMKSVNNRSSVLESQQNLDVSLVAEDLEALLEVGEHGRECSQLATLLRTSFLVLA